MFPNVEECFVIVWYFKERNMRPLESPHYYTYMDAVAAANRIVRDGDNADVEYFKIEKRWVVR